VENPPGLISDDLISGIAHRAEPEAEPEADPASDKVHLVAQ
jgi:hypothetical protein